MKKYLSSYRIWNHWEKLLSMMWENKKIAYIANAIDNKDSEKSKVHYEWNMAELKGIWLDPEQLDLREYFWEQDKLELKLKDFWWVYVNWWNTFILAQAYELSWFWKIMLEYEKSGTWFVYAWYSAWVCILSPSLKWLDIVDDPNIHPYPELQRTIWEWLWIINYAFSPHYDSDHPESADIEKEIQYCIDNKILFKALRDWEVIIEE